MNAKYNSLVTILCGLLWRIPLKSLRFGCTVGFLIIPISPTVLTAQSAKAIDNVALPLSPVKPGTYILTLTFGEFQSSQHIEVLPVPDSRFRHKIADPHSEVSDISNSHAY